MARLGVICVLMALMLIQGIWSEKPDMPYSKVVSFIKENSDPDVIPISEGGEPLKVRVDLSLMSLLDVDKEWNEVEVMVWQTMTWTNPYLRWDFDTDITSVSLPAKYLWTPDITLYNSVKAAEIASPELAVVSRDGTVLFVPSVRMRFSCDLQGLDSSSGVNCTMKLGSWTYNGLTLTLEDGVNFDTSGYMRVPRYSLLGAHTERNVLYYACCPEPYEDYAFTLTLKEN